MGSVQQFKTKIGDVHRAVSYLENAMKRIDSSEFAGSVAANGTAPSFPSYDEFIKACGEKKIDKKTATWVYKWFTRHFAIKEGFTKGEQRSLRGALRGSTDAR